jgi:peptidoglycan/xylan/chitin deacetylase (PgdA/CDA1 family)
MLARTLCTGVCVCFCVSCGELGLHVLSWNGARGALSFSFDDSPPSQIEHYTELQATGAKLTFYTTTSGGDWEDNYDQTWAQAVEDGHEIGNHTQHHGLFSEHPSDYENEIDQCTSYIISRFGQADVWTTAYPYGDTGWEECSKQRFLLGRGFSTSGTIRPLDDGVDPFDLPVLAVMEDTGEIPGNHPEQFINGPDAMATAIDSVRTNGAWGILVFHTILPTSQDWGYVCRIDHITSAIEHAQQWGDIWIDTVANTGAYFLAEKMFAGLTPSGHLERTWTWTMPANIFSARK